MCIINRSNYTSLMKLKSIQSAIPDENIASKIYIIRDLKIMLDEDLAELYGVTTGNLNKAVKRNISRFPADFMFQLTKDEFNDLIFQIGRSSWGGRRIPPFAFTELGVAMLSGVLTSDVAVKVNIQIMRVFVTIRTISDSHDAILRKLEHLEKKDIEQDEKIILILEYLKQLEEVRKQEIDQKNRTPIGYKRNEL